MKIAVLGYGTVGSGVVQVLKDNQDLITERAGREIEVKYVLDLRDFPGQDVQKLIVHDYDTIVNDPEIEVVVEVMGGIEPANTFVKKALLSGKSVVTSNKALVAQCGTELLKTAKDHKVNFLFEASVGGGIPIIRALGSSLTADKIEKISGILNGTTNYMMTKMFYDGEDYASVLKQAQQNGYAEADPTADVEGYDACRKIAILGSIISGKRVDFEEIYTEGITKISVEDMLYAKKMGMTIKLLAKCSYEGDRLCALVAPYLVSTEHPLYNVNHVFNAVFVKGNMLGDAMFYGSGAGKLPTASAVVADIIAAAKNPDKNIMNFWTDEKMELADIKSTEKRFFIRMQGDKNNFREKLQNDFGKVSFVETDELKNEFGFLTEKIKEEKYNEAAGAYSNILHMIRVED